MSVKLIQLLDSFIGTMLVFFIGIFKKKKGVPEIPERILVIQLWGLGETVLTLPAIKWLNENKALSTVEVLTTERVAQVFEGVADTIVVPMNPFKLFLFMLKNRKRWDVVYDFEEYLNVSTLISRFVGKRCVGFGSDALRAANYDRTVEYDLNDHMVHNFCRVAGAPKPEKLIPLKTEGAVNDLPKKYVVLAPEVAESARQRLWETWKWVAIADLLAKDGYEIHVLSKGGTDRSDIIVLDAKTENIYKLVAGLKKMAKWLEHCDLFIGLDSGPLHVASAMGCPTLGLFGPNTPIRWRPYTDKGMVVYHERECSPCIDNMGNVETCKDNKCMQAITVDEVYEQAKWMLGHYRKL
jgi:ADP-heptose:LPS heptosyltransferase